MENARLDSVNIALIYAQGTDLKDAPFRFASQEIRRKWSAASANLFKFKAPKVDSKDGNLQGIANALGDFASRSLEVNSIEFDAQAFLLDRLKSKYAFAIGFAVPRQIVDNPIFIPADLYAREYVHWVKNIMAGNGLDFHGVKIVSRSDFDKIAGQTMPEKVLTNKRRPGRPSAGILISAAYSELKNAGRINYSAPMKIAILNIREIIGKSQNPSLVPSVETIRRIISKDFREPQN